MGEVYQDTGNDDPDIYNDIHGGEDHARLHMRLGALRPLEQVQAHYVAGEGKDGYPDHRQKIRRRLMPDKSPYDLEKTENGKHRLKISRYPRDLFLAGDGIPDCEERQAVDDAVGEHVETVCNKAHRTCDEAGDHLRYEKKEVDGKHLAKNAALPGMFVGGPYIFDGLRGDEFRIELQAIERVEDPAVTVCVVYLQQPLRYIKYEVPDAGQSLKP